MNQDFRDERSVGNGGNDFHFTDEWSWRLERNKLAFALGLILETVKLADKESISLVSALKKLSHDSEGKRIDRENPLMFRFYETGVEAMNRVNSKWQKVDLPFRMSCRAIVAQIGL